MECNKDLSTSNGQILIACNKDLSARRGQILIAFNKDLSVRRAPFLSFVLMKLLWKTNIFVHYTKVEKARTNEKKLVTESLVQLNSILGFYLFSMLILKCLVLGEFQILVKKGNQLGHFWVTCSMDNLQFHNFSFY